MPETNAPIETSEEAATLSAIATRNLAVAMSLRASAWQLTESGLRAFRPCLSDDQVQLAVRAQFRRTAG